MAEQDTHEYVATVPNHELGRYAAAGETVRLIERRAQYLQCWRKVEPEAEAEPAGSGRRGRGVEADREPGAD